ncbi:Nephrocystin-3 [Mycena venus]|uniref:Nephrocystin-3 n=1 Tax=Mycena venus TaxID=2733690 RepID=A0A8H7DE33_9AGAR|nr:Nephrocystin-3 [Mycena venus]
MLGRGIDAQTLNNYISGGQGGPGGEGYEQGTGGHGGAGQGPIVHQHYYIKTEHFTMNNGYARLAAVQATQIVNSCPPPSRMFHGRQNILEKMHHFFMSNAGIQHIYVLHGFGGVGKTEIALKFINESSSYFSDIFFINASTIATIDTGLKNIAIVKDSGDFQQDGLLWLTSRVEKWLLVFDNTDVSSKDMNDFIPQCNHGNIIITSQNPGLCAYAGAHSLVSDMEENDAVALLLKSAAQEATVGTEQSAKEIVKALHYSPLAIVQAGTCISKSQDLDGYLALYKKPAQSHDQHAQTGSKKTTELRKKLDLTFIMVSTGEGNGVKDHLQVRFLLLTATWIIEFLFEILLTVTPAHVNAQGAQVSQHPLAWKVFDFRDTMQKVEWNEVFAFATVVQDLPDVDRPGFTCLVEPSEYATLEQNGALVPSGKLQSGSLAFGVQNQSVVPATLALCTVEAIHPNHNQCCPLLELRDLKNDVLVEFEPPFQLQAYVVSNYQEGQVLKPKDQHCCLFLDARGNPQPLEISQLLSIPSPTFCLKAEPSGSVTLDKAASSAYQMY